MHTDTKGPTEQMWLCAKPKCRRLVPTGGASSNLRQSLRHICPKMRPYKLQFKQRERRAGGRASTVFNRLLASDNSVTFLSDFIPSSTQVIRMLSRLIFVKCEAMNRSPNVFFACKKAGFDAAYELLTKKCLEARLYQSHQRRCLGTEGQIYIRFALLKLAKVVQLLLFRLSGEFVYNG